MKLDPGKLWECPNCRKNFTINQINKQHPMPEMNRVICSTFPRSGHQLLVRLLRIYFASSGKFFYSKDFPQKYPQNPETSTIHFQKNHDPGLEYGENTNINTIQKNKTIIQIRHPLESICSFYTHRRHAGTVKLKESEWKIFALEKIYYWKRFVKTWGDQGLIIRYQDIIREPIQTIHRIAAFIGEPQNPFKLPEKIEVKNRIGYFKFYDPKFFSEIEDLATNEIKKYSLEVL